MSKKLKYALLYFLFGYSFQFFVYGFTNPWYFFPFKMMSVSFFIIGYIIGKDKDKGILGFRKMVFTIKFIPWMIFLGLLYIWLAGKFGDWIFGV